MSQPASAQPAAGAAKQLLRGEWQPILFAERLRRNELLKLRPHWPCREVVIRVHRNHAFEPVAGAMSPFLAYADFEGRFQYGAYDDSLSFQDLEGGADIEFLWLDFERYGPGADVQTLLDWLLTRLRALRERSAASIVIGNWAPAGVEEASFNARLSKSAVGLPGCHVFDLAAIAQTLGERFLDHRAEAVAGTPLGNRACLEVARQLGARYVPALMAPRIKAIVVDLDETLYQGVLGEDGVRAVQLTLAHRALQTELLRLQEQGVLLAIASHNDPADVESLFRERPDFPLRPKRISTWAVGWDPKTLSLGRIAEQLRIDPSAMLFIDDNPGEIAAVAEAIPSLRCLIARPDADETLRSLRDQPGLLRLRDDVTDTLRAGDLATSALRERLERESSDPLSYLSSLELELAFMLDPGPALGRLHELSQKTNQMNLSLSRFSEVEVSRRLDDEASRVIAISLRDRLSDSGIIGAFFARHEGHAVVVEELCISCRALGRSLEDLMVGESIRRLSEEWPDAERVFFETRQGPRNQPARQWLERATGTEVVGDRRIELEMAAGKSLGDRGALPVRVQWRDAADG
jgi:FkbH-like protein